MESFRGVIKKGVASCRANNHGCGFLKSLVGCAMAPLAVLMMNTNLMLDSDVDDPVVEDSMVDDGSGCQ